MPAARRVAKGHGAVKAHATRSVRPASNFSGIEGIE